MPTFRTTSPEVAAWTPATPPAGPSARVTGRIPPDPQTVDLTEAEVIFSAGKGCDPAVFDQLKELCRLLNVSFGVTRPVFDLGWTGFERMVGQTGRTVTPRFYLALGISGSMHHVGGIKDSRRIVAVNSDAKAPIFINSDEGFVADLRDVLPRLLERVKSTTGGAP
jgi:electron transfer flavoprotein alpha subunit